MVRRKRRKARCNVYLSYGSKGTKGRGGEMLLIHYSITSSSYSRVDAASQRTGRRVMRTQRHAGDSCAARKVDEATTTASLSSLPSFTSLYHCTSLWNSCTSKRVLLYLRYASLHLSVSKYNSFIIDQMQHKFVQ